MYDIVSLLNEKVLKRFWDKVNVKSDEECWEWKAGKGGTSAYGIFHIMIKPYHRHNLTAHKASYIINNKANIPDELEVCHKCDNPICVNPGHLFLGTPSENAYDKINKGRAKYRDNKGESNNNSKLTKEDVLEIRNKKLGGALNSDLALEYGVKKACISKIVTKRTWKEI